MKPGTRVLKGALVGALAVWASSWRIMYLEVHRWHHLDARLRFAPPPTPPGFPPARAGVPVRAARAAAVLAPPVSVALACSCLRAARLTGPAAGPPPRGTATGR
ncbi:hypothetical protein [Amycolatopsis sp. NPDC004625]|uniref:hypothetical protein n=1 Tax=Amycolatopsis sp. NPDC004625 TaxID=3154670 RepID=UPI00339DE2EF